MSFSRRDFMGLPIAGVLDAGPPPEWLGGPLGALIGKLGGQPLDAGSTLSGPLDALTAFLPTLDGPGLFKQPQPKQPVRTPENQVTGPSPTGASSAPAPVAGPSAGVTPLELAIDAATQDPRLRVAMRLAAFLEGGDLTTWGAGDGGRSYGPYQINTNLDPRTGKPIHNVSRQQAEDPVFATNYMLPAYRAALAAVPVELWQTDPQRAAALTVFYAERPAQFYNADRVSYGWRQVAGRTSGYDGRPAATPAGSAGAAVPSGR